MTDGANINKELFAHLVISLAQSALMHMGKLVNPGAGKADVNLEAAQMTIDLLDMLEVKTRGNVDKDEERFIKATISELKLNFVETAKDHPAGAPQAAPEAKPEPKIEAPPESPKSDEDKTRFRKSYG
ncbi:MAG TPA: DUF1844 domain-containing protein [Kiritimatiellia bacterium]|jgi:ribosomal protein L12E/L44/L45/RPP1/RPP2